MATEIYPGSSLFAAFAPYINDTAPALRRILPDALSYARIEKAAPPGDREIVIDRASLLAGIVRDGIRDPDNAATSAWTVEWLKEEGIDPQTLGSGRKPDRSGTSRAHAQGVPIICSRSLRNRILPDAQELARKTVGRKQADLRHILFALLLDKAEDAVWRPFLTDDQIARLLRRLVERISKYPERGEKVRAWQALLRPQSRKGAPSGQEEKVTTLADAPAIVDNLGRQAFAEVLGKRIREVQPTLRKKGAAGDSAFILHLDGAWGSGKSSVLNFLKSDLEASDPRWLVVEFNAWRNQHRRPAWLPLILQVRSAAIWRMTRWTPFVWLMWLWWRLRMDWLPYLLAVLLISVAAFLAWSLGFDAATTGTDGFKGAGEVFKALVAIVAAVGSVLALARGFTLGSHRNAELYLETKTEPFRRIIRYFGWLVRMTRRPVAVFVDDLDRCDSDYVIELLEGIQTSLRAAPVVYVVAGDRKWICSSFEKRYADFCEEIGSPGRPLGYLFLDKVFQLSTSLPQLSRRRQTDYWLQLLRRTPGSPETQAEEKRQLAKRAEQELANKTTQEDIQREIDRTAPNSLERETWLAAAAKQTVSEETVAATKHRLERFAHLLEPNPRSMKRLVNAYGLNQARAFLEERKATAETLIRWTILELRWPLLTDYLAGNWPEIAAERLLAKDYPDAIRALLADPEVASVIGTGRDKGRLTIKALKPILD